MIFRAVLYVFSCLVLLNSTYAKAGVNTDLTPAFFIEYAVDDNLFRYSASELEDGFDPEDEIRTMGMGLSSETKISRQLLAYSLMMYSVEYKTHDRLNYYGGDADLKWDWLVGRRWKGKLNLNASRKRSENNEFVSLNDVITSNQQLVELKYLINNRLRVELSGLSRKQSHSALIQRLANRDVYQLGAGVSVISKSRAEVLSYAELKRIIFPDRAASDGLTSSVAQYKAVIRAKVLPTVNTEVRGQYGIIKRNNLNIPSRNYQGVIGFLNISWSQRPRLRSEIKIHKNVFSSDYSIASHYVAQGVDFNNAYTVSSKVEVSASLEAVNHDYAVIDSATSWKETILRAKFGVKYQISKILLSSLSVDRFYRDSSVDDRRVKSNQYSAELMFLF